MRGPVLIRGGRLVDLDPPAVDFGDIRLEGGTIVDRAPALSPRPSDEVVDAAGKTVIPGLVCAHTHVYSALARGMPGPDDPPRNFREILERIWWRLDRALDGHSILFSGLVAATDAIRCGTTLLVDHHASPAHILGSLGLLQIAFEEVGIRAALCYEVTERNGTEDRDLGIEETIAFLRANQSERFRGLVGAHASFTLSDESLVRLGEISREFDSGVHIHVAEDPCDLPAGDCDGTDLVHRLERTRVLGPKTILGHCTHLGSEALARVRDSGSWMVHNTRSNMNNQVGYARVDEFGDQAALGTDGIGGDVFTETRFAYFQNRNAKGSLSAEGAFRLMTGGHRLATRLFGLPFGRLRPGAAADVVVLDYRSPTPFTAENLPWHFVFGLGAEHVETVVVGGRIVLAERRFTSVNPAWVAERSRTVAADLWCRMAAI